MDVSSSKPEFLMERMERMLRELLKENLELQNCIQGLLKTLRTVPVISLIAAIELAVRGYNQPNLNEIVQQLQDLKEMEGGEHRPEHMVDIVYRRLEESSQEAFLYIAFYFCDWERSKVADIVGKTALVDLEKQKLVTISEESKVEMDDLVQARARKLSKGNRVTDWESLSILLRNRDLQKLKEIKVIYLPDGDKNYYIKAKDLDLMHKSLRVLYLGNNTKISGRCTKNFEQLRFLRISYEALLSGGPKLLKRLRKSERFECLVVCLTERRINYEEEITIKLPESLRLRCLEVDVPDSLPLHASPSLHIKGGFVSLGESLGNFSCLKSLRLDSCSRLSSLPESIGNLSSLQHLVISHCSYLSSYWERSFPESIGNLFSLQHSVTSHCPWLMWLPESIGNLSSLQHLVMSHVSGFRSLPESIGNLSSLQHLVISHCPWLWSLPESIGNLSSLQHLVISHVSGFRSLPYNFGTLSSLQHLVMSHCSMLSGLPDSFCHLSSLQHLDMSHCSMVEGLPDSFGSLSSLQHLDVSYCSSLRTLPDSLRDLRSLQFFNKTQCERLIFPGGLWPYFDFS